MPAWWLRVSVARYMASVHNLEEMRYDSKSKLQVLAKMCCDMVMFLLRFRHVKEKLTRYPRLWESYGTWRRPVNKWWLWFFRCSCWSCQYIAIAHSTVTILSLISYDLPAAFHNRNYDGITFTLKRARYILMTASIIQKESLLDFWRCDRRRVTVDSK